MRLLHAIQTSNPAAGGPVEGMRQLSRINMQHGHTIEAVTMDASVNAWAEQPGFKVHALGPGRTGYGYANKYVPWLRIHAREYDCIIVNGIWGFNGYGTWLALRNSGVPYVVFTHGMLDPWFKRRYPLKHLKKWLYWPWGGYPLLRDAAAVFFTCNRERQLARESFWLYRCNEVVINYGTQGIPNPEQDYRSEFLAAHPSLRGKRVFLFFGRVHPKKGPDLFLRAVGELRRRGAWDPNTMRLVLAGPSDGGYARELNELAASEGIAESVYWTGLLTGDARWGALQSAELFVLPSHQENFGLAVAEALSASIPVLLGKGVNIWPEIVADGAGLAAEASAAECTRMLLEWLSFSPARKAAMARQARVTFQNRYRIETAAEDLIRHLEDLIPARRAHANVSAGTERATEHAQ